MSPLVVEAWLPSLSQECMLSPVPFSPVESVLQWSLALFAKFPVTPSPPVPQALSDSQGWQILLSSLRGPECSVQGLCAGKLVQTGRKCQVLQKGRNVYCSNGDQEFDSVKSNHSNSGSAPVTEDQMSTLKAVTLSLKAKFIVKLDTTHFPISPCKKDLEKAIQQFSLDEKKKKIRASNKNLYQACKSNDLERVLYLLYEGIDPMSSLRSTRNSRPFMWRLQRAIWPSCIY